MKPSRSTPRTGLTAAAALVLCTGSLAAGGEVTTADGRGSDNQVMGFGDDREGLNKGGASTMEVRGHSYSGNSYHGVLRFDLATAEGVKDATEAGLTLKVTGEKLTPGTVVLFGLDDGYAAGEDQSGKPELSEDAYTEGSSNWAASGNDTDLTGDNAPGMREKMAGVEAFSWFGSPFTRLGEVEVAEGDTELAFGPSAEIAEFLKGDTNGLAVFYLASGDAFIQLGTKEGGSPATLTFD